MYQTWGAIKKQYPNQWVVLINARFQDKFHQRLLGGEVFLTAKDQEEMFKQLPKAGYKFTCQHTNEGAIEDGYLKSFV